MSWKNPPQSVLQNSRWMSVHRFIAVGMRRKAKWKSSLDLECLANSHSECLKLKAGAYSSFVYAGLTEHPTFIPKLTGGPFFTLVTVHSSYSSKICSVWPIAFQGHLSMLMSCKLSVVHLRPAAAQDVLCIFSATLLPQKTRLLLTTGDLKSSFDRWWEHFSIYKGLFLIEKNIPQKLMSGKRHPACPTVKSRPMWAKGKEAFITSNVQT